MVGDTADVLTTSFTFTAQLSIPLLGTLGIFLTGASLAEYAVPTGIAVSLTKNAMTAPCHGASAVNEAYTMDVNASLS